MVEQITMYPMTLSLDRAFLSVKLEQSYVVVRRDREGIVSFDQVL